MRVIKTNTNPQGEQIYLLKKDNRSGTHIEAVVSATGRIQFRDLTTGKTPTAHDLAAAMRAVREYREQS